MHYAWCFIAAQSSKLLHSSRETINSSFLFLGEPKQRVGGVGTADHFVKAVCHVS